MSKQSSAVRDIRIGAMAGYAASWAMDRATGCTGTCRGGQSNQSLPEGILNTGGAGGNITINPPSDSQPFTTYNFSGGFGTRGGGGGGHCTDQSLSTSCFTLHGPISL